MTRTISRRLEASACPRHGDPLAGGPVLFDCPKGHSVYAADLDPEFVPTGRVVAR